MIYFSFSLFIIFTMINSTYFELNSGEERCFLITISKDHLFLNLHYEIKGENPEKTNFLV